MALTDAEATPDDVPIEIFTDGACSGNPGPGGWGAVLRAVSAFRAYHQVYHDIITPERVAELLILRANMPRSLRFCFDQVATLLEPLSGGRRLECLRLAGEFDAKLRYGRVEHILDEGLHEYLNGVLARIAEISTQVSRDFLMTN